MRQIVSGSVLATAAIILLAALSAPAQSTISVAPHAHIVTISPSGVRGSEPSIAVNPSNPNQVIAAFQLLCTLHFDKLGSCLVLGARRGAQWNFLCGARRMSFTIVKVGFAEFSDEK